MLAVVAESMDRSSANLARGNREMVTWSIAHGITEDRMPDSRSNEDRQEGAVNPYPRDV